jgi:tripartite-type tricarboxylate transporter receptor subunit TctC
MRISIKIFIIKLKIVFWGSIFLSFQSIANEAITNDILNYPTKPIRLILPFPSGGGTDNLSRIMAPKLKQLLGQAIIVDNHPGASGNIATDLVVKAPRDGHTILMGYSTALTFNPLIYQGLSFDVQKDLKPITMLASAKYFLVVNSSLPIKSVKELVAYAKEKPGQLNYSSGGNGSSFT